MTSPTPVMPSWAVAVPAAVGALAPTAGMIAVSFDQTCTTCGGRGGSLGQNEWNGWLPCPDCINGQVPLPSGPFAALIGTTSAELRVQPSVILGVATVQALPIVDITPDDLTVPYVYLRHDSDGDAVFVWDGSPDQGCSGYATRFPGDWTSGNTAVIFTEFQTDAPVGSVKLSRANAAWAARHDFDTVPCPIPWTEAPDRPCVTRIEFAS